MQTPELLDETEEEAALPHIKTYTLCSVEEHRRKKWMQNHRCDKQPKKLGFGTMAAHWICFRAGMINDDCWIECSCGEKYNLTHWEHA